MVSLPAVDKRLIPTNIFQNVYEDDPICFLNSSSNQPIGLHSLLTLGYCNRIIVGDPVPRNDIFPPELKYSSERDCNELITEDGHLRLDRILPILDHRSASRHFFLLSVKLAVWGLQYFNQQKSIFIPEYEIVAPLPYNRA